MDLSVDKTIVLHNNCQSALYDSLVIAKPQGNPMSTSKFTPVQKRKLTSPPTTSKPARKKPTLSDELFGLFPSDDDEDSEHSSRDQKGVSSIERKPPLGKSTPASASRVQFTPVEVYPDTSSSSEDENARAAMHKTEFKSSSKVGTKQGLKFGSESSHGKNVLGNSNRAKINAVLTTPERDKLRAQKDKENRTPPETNER